MSDRNKYASEEALKLYEHMEDKLNEIINQLNEMKIDIAKMPECIFERGDEKYASKRVEKVMWAMFGAIGLAILAALLKLIMIQ